jgi:signal transduction histidine kinase/ActR/RegA family two-component response regulator
MPLGARLYVAAVVAGGALLLIAVAPRTVPQPILFAVMTIFACVTSTWKVNLPIVVTNGSTLSVSYAANLMSLLLLGPGEAVIVATAGAWTQCVYRPKEPYPLHRTVFSAATAVITMSATGAVFRALGGTTPLDTLGSARPLVGAIATYFLVNTSLIAGAISISSRRGLVQTWRQDFLWSGATFMVAGTAGALAAVVVQRGEHWKAVLLIAPIYVTYRTYELFAGRLEDQKKHTEEVQRLHQGTITALEQARAAERELAAEKERLAAALVEMTKLQELRKQLLAREQAARASAEDASQLKDQFLAIVSHELRTPLNSILGWSDMLSKGILDGPRQERALATIHQSAKRQAHLIEDLLDVARIASGKLQLNPALVDLRDIARDALLVSQPAADAKGIHLGFDADPRLGRVHGDPARLQQITSNLISNALKFTPEGGAVHIQLRRSGSSAELIVSDTGKGIPPDFLTSVFEPFRQADGSTTRRHGGLGLGLSIVRNLVQAHNGTVEAQSAGEGQGATFVVRLPMIADDADAGASRPIRNADTPRRLPSLQGVAVLVVDDDQESREVVATQLHGCQANVLTASCAAEAFELLQRERVDVLLADIGMPDEDGYSLIRRVRALGQSAALVPAAALTAFARDEDRRCALQAGYQLHLTKPIDATSLLAAVATLGKTKLSAPRAAS